MSRTIYSPFCRTSGPASVARRSRAASHLTRTIASTPWSAARRTRHLSHGLLSREDRGASGDGRVGPDVHEHPAWMTEVADLGNGFLPEEASLREVDRALETDLGRQGVRSEIDSHPRDPSPDAPRLEVGRVHLDQPRCTQALDESGCAIGRDDDVRARARHRRRQDDRLEAIGDAHVPEDGHQCRPVGAILDLHVRREHVGTQDRVHALRLLRCLEEEERAVHGGDVEVGPDPAGGGEEQAAEGPAIRHPLDVGRDQILQPRTGVGSPYGDDTPVRERREGACAPQSLQIR